VRNKGSAGVDGMEVTELYSYLENNRDRIVTSILNHTYVPKPIEGVEIPKENGKTRLLGVPKLLSYYIITVSCRYVFAITNIRKDSIFRFG
jgi:retron-type reverse transcriptase